MNEKKKRGKKIGIVLLILTALMVAGIGAGISYVLMVISEAPVINTADAEPDGYRTSVLDLSGEVALNLSDSESNRVYVRLDEMPEELYQAFIAIEDERFYKHHGVDLKGLARAVFRGLTNGGVTQGASTITQQLLKNNVFTDWMSEENFEDKLERKIKEQYLAVQLEQKVSKEWILEKYLNTINLGGGNLGVQTASRYYFDKDVSALTVSECAALAAITKNPTKYNPAREPEANSGRREIVLQKMLEQGYISEEEYNAAEEDDVYGRIAAVREKGNTIEIMSYFEEAMIYEILEDLQKETGVSEDEAWNLLYRGGLTIYSTEDSAVQKMCEEAVNACEVDDPDTQLSLVLMDNESGQVRAMIGGRGEKTANLVLNRAVNTERQPGSTIKIIGEYASGFENGDLTLGTVIDDAPTAYSDGTEVHNSSGIYGGMTTIRQAIADSSNIVALKCFNEQGINSVLAGLAEFGITTLNAEDRVESLALGGTKNGVTNLEMTTAYGVLARGGAYIEPVYYTKILDHDGNVLIEKKPDSHVVVQPETAALLTYAMEDVIRKGTGTDAAFDGMSIAGKTGTTSGTRDAWMIGYSPYYTCGVWGGLDSGGKQESGAYVRKLWAKVMKAANKGLEDTGFSLLSGMEKYTICTKCGKLAVEGLCDRTVQGDMTREEIYAAGTAPTQYCDCHEEITFCADSHQSAGVYCKNKETKVYLKRASEGTEDEEYVMPSDLKVCSQHKGLFTPFFGGGDDKQDSWGNDHSDDENNGSWWGNNNNNKQDNEDKWENNDDNEKKDGHWWDIFTGGNDSSEDSGNSGNDEEAGEDSGDSDSGNDREERGSDEEGHWWDIFLR